MGVRRISRLTIDYADHVLSNPSALPSGPAQGQAAGPKALPQRKQVQKGTSESSDSCSIRAMSRDNIWSCKLAL